METAWAIAAAAGVFVVLLFSVSVLVTRSQAAVLRPLRMVGPAAKRFSGFVLIAVGVWFAVLALSATPLLTV